MTQFEGYLIRLKISLRSNKMENELTIVQSIHDAYKKYLDEPELTDDEKSYLADELRRSEYERLQNRGRD